jgi:hypothetical protein
VLRVRLRQRDRKPATPQALQEGRAAVRWQENEWGDGAVVMIVGSADALNILFPMGGDLSEERRRPAA